MKIADASQLDESDSDSQVVSYIPDRCVRLNKRFASCRACIDACFSDALSIRNFNISFDSEQCVACELCVSACNEEAFVSIREPHITESSKAKYVSLSCTKNQDTSAVSNQNLNCLASLSLSMIAKLYLKGIRTYLVLAGDCSSCEYPFGKIPTHIEQFNRYLRSLRVPEITCELLDKENYEKITQKFSEQEVTLSRRGFFRDAFGQAVNKSNEILNAADVQPPSLISSLKKLGKLRPESSSSLFFVEIDEESCNLCSDCTRVCSHGALSIEKRDDNNAIFYIKSQLCTACELCVDICPMQAISVDTERTGNNFSIELQDQSCRTCGNTFFEFHQSDQSRCSICRQKMTSQEQNMFQVYD